MSGTDVRFRLAAPTEKLRLLAPAIMEDIITNFELKSTRLLRVCPCCGLVQDKTFDLHREQETLAEPCPTCQFNFPVMPETTNSTAVFKDVAEIPEAVKEAAE